MGADIPFRPSDANNVASTPHVVHTKYWTHFNLERHVSEDAPNWGAFFGTTTPSVDEYDAMEKMTAANGCRTVGECYALGVDPEDPNDDLKITGFEMKDGKPVITLNHTEDGSSNSFMPRVKTLGKATLSDAEEWREVQWWWDVVYLHRHYSIWIKPLSRKQRNISVYL